MATDEQKAMCYVLDILLTKGQEWERRDPNASQKASRAAKAKFSSITKNELETHLMHGGPKSEFAEDKVIFLTPPAKEDAGIAALWCRWDYEKALPRCGFYFGLWSPRASFPKVATEQPKDRQIGFIGYRFETPEEDDNHNYYHSQPCRSMGSKDDEIEVALPFSYRMPTWPLAAKCSLELLLCVVTSIYGMKGLLDLEETISLDTRARQNPLLRAAVKSLLDTRHFKAAG